MNRLLRLVCPLIAGKKNCVPEATLPKPPEFWDTLMGETPGDSDSSCVKLRPFNGRSSTCLVPTTAPNSAVDCCSNSPDASTVRVCCTAPTCRETSIVAVWFTAKPIRGTCVVWKPG